MSYTSLLKVAKFRDSIDQKMQYNTPGISFHGATNSTMLNSSLPIFFEDSYKSSAWNSKTHHLRFANIQFLDENAPHDTIRRQIKVLRGLSRWMVWTIHWPDGVRLECWFVQVFFHISEIQPLSHNVFSEVWVQNSAEWGRRLRSGVFLR